jgi:hypothetical protein
LSALFCTTDKQQKREEHLKTIYSLHNFTVTQLVKYQEERADLLRAILFVDETRQLWSADPVEKEIFKFSDIKDWELVEFYEGFSQGDGGAIIGGMLFGVTGAIMGDSIGTKKSIKNIQKMHIKVCLKDFSNPITYIDILTTATKSNTKKYRNARNAADKALALFKLMSIPDEISPKDKPQEP